MNLGIGLFLLVAVGLLALIVWLLSRQRTRAFGTGVLVVCATLALIGPALMYWGTRGERRVTYDWPGPMPDARPSAVDRPVAVDEAFTRVDQVRDAVTRARGEMRDAVVRAHNEVQHAAARLRSDACQLHRPPPPKVAPDPAAGREPPESDSAGDQRPPGIVEKLEDAPASAATATAPADAPPVAEGHAERPAGADASATADTPAAGPDAEQPTAPRAEAEDLAAASAAAPDVVPKAHAAPVARRAPPEWVTVPPKRVGNSYQRTVCSDPFSSDRECHQQLDQILLRTTCEYLEDLLGTDYVRRGDNYRFAAWLRDVGITPAYIRRHICADEYVEPVDSSVDQLVDPGFGQMRRIHVLMEFDDEVQRDLRRRWQEAQLVKRLAVVGGGAAAILSFLGLVFAYLKLDTATKGFYTRRLQLVTGLVTILLVAAIAAAIAIS